MFAVGNGILAATYRVLQSEDCLKSALLRVPFAVADAQGCAVS